tara:strand:+ start:574 stop:1596 length:1023 start_codon:yes stop_codon:yes gene_type:complete
MWETWMRLERTTYLQRQYDDETLTQLKLAKLAVDDCHNRASDELKVKMQQYYDLKRKGKYVDATYTREATTKRRQLRRRIALRLAANYTNFQKRLTHSKSYRSLEKKFSAKSMVLLYTKNQEFEKCVNLSERATLVLQMMICRVTIVEQNLHNPTLLYALPRSDLKTAATPMLSTATRTLAKKLLRNLKQEIPDSPPRSLNHFLSDIASQGKVLASIPAEKINLTSTRVRRILIREACLSANRLIRPKKSITGRFSPEILLELLHIIDPDLDMDLRSIQSIQSDYDAKTVNEQFKNNSPLVNQKFAYALFSSELADRYFKKYKFTQPHEIADKFTPRKEI